MMALQVGEVAVSEEKRRVAGVQNISRMCLVCGAENVLGLHVSFFELEPPTGADEAGRAQAETQAQYSAPPPPLPAAELLGVFTARAEHQSYPGRLHGGISSAVLDETIGRAISIAHPGTWGVTAELTVRYLQPVPLDVELRVLGRITRDTRRLFEGTGEILLPDGTVAVKARGKYVRMTLEEIAPAGFDESEWFTDPRGFPEDVSL
jgi:uncharacterized protein (TIGR00369 family)